MYIDIVDADDIKSEEKYQNLKRKQSLNDKEYLKLTKCRIKNNFNNCISQKLVWFTFEKKQDLYLYKNQLGVLRKLIIMNKSEEEERDDFNTFLKDTNMCGEMQTNEQLKYHVNTA